MAAAAAAAAAAAVKVVGEAEGRSRSSVADDSVGPSRPRRLSWYPSLASAGETRGRKSSGNHRDARADTFDGVTGPGDGSQCSDVVVVGPGAAGVGRPADGGADLRRAVLDAERQPVRG